MESVATKPQLINYKAKSSLGSFFLRLNHWVCRKCLPIGGLTFGTGLLIKADVITTNMLSLMPILGNVIMIAGLVLTVLGIITKGAEVIRLFKKKK